MVKRKLFICEISIIIIVICQKLVSVGPVQTCLRLVLLSVVSKVFEKLANNNLVDHLEKCGLF